MTTEKRTIWFEDGIGWTDGAWIYGAVGSYDQSGNGNHMLYMSDEPNGSNWIDVTATGSPYQHFINTDGRHRWRLSAKPEDSDPPEWRPGKPPNAGKE